MSNTKPEIPLIYDLRVLNAHDGERYIFTAWNEEYGIFLVAPQYPNARYDRQGALEEIRRAAFKAGCYLDKETFL